MIRAMRPTDALTLGLARGRATWDVFTAPTWPRTPPESRQQTVFSLLRHALFLGPSAGHVGVALADGQLCGFVVLRPRAAGLVWDVTQLAARDMKSAVALMRWGAERALASGGRRVMIDTPDVGPACSMARQAGFEPYTGGVTCTLDAGFQRAGADTMPARPRFRADEPGLFQLYTAAVPASVRAAEAMTQEEWAALYPGRKPWSPGVLGTTRDDYVWEMGARVIGWMRVTYGQRSQALELLVHPMYEAYADRMVSYALTQVSTKVPVLSDVREYQSGVRMALERASFRPGPRYLAWYRALASRVPEPARAAVQAPASPG